MIYRYSIHALERMKERQISKTEVNVILHGQTDVVVVPSKTDDSVHLLIGFVQTRGIAVIVNHQEKNVITVRRLRPNEIKLLKEEIS